MTDNAVHNILAYVAQKCSQFIINTARKRVKEPGTYIVHNCHCLSSKVEKVLTIVQKSLERETNKIKTKTKQIITVPV